MRIKELLNLTWIDVLTAADNHVLPPSADTEIPVLEHHRQVSRVQPAIRIDRLARSLTITIVALHHRIPTRAQLADFTAWQRLTARGIDNLHFCARQRAPHGSN